MTIASPALWAGSATHLVRTVRHAAATYLSVPMTTHANSATATTRGGGYGVTGWADLTVTTTGALGYSIAAGHFALPGTFATAQGPYVDYNDAAVAGTLPARDATNPYIAYICARVRDTDEDATGAETTDFTVVQGTPAATPAAPAVASSLGSLFIMSEVLVPSAANGGPVVFTDRRMWLNAVGGIQRCSSGTRPSGGAAEFGKLILEWDTKRLYGYDGSAYIPFGAIGPYATASVTLISQFNPLTNTGLEVRYQQVGKKVDAEINFTITSAGVAGNDIGLTGVTLPTIRANRYTAGTFVYNRTGVQFYSGAAQLTTAGVINFIAAGSVAGGLGTSPSFAAANGDIVHINLGYEAA